jgi:hypothetical protein
LSYAPYANEYVAGKVNSRFGPSEAYLLPLYRNCDSTFVEFDQISFICFEDDSLYYNPTNEACAYYLGLNESQLNKVSVFPNPSSGKIELLSEIPLKTVQVVNLLGSKMKEFNVNLTMQQIDLSDLPQGTYYLNIENSNGEQIIKPIQLSGS